MLILMDSGPGKDPLISDVSKYHRAIQGTITEAQKLGSLLKDNLHKSCLAGTSYILVSTTSNKC